MLKYLLVSFVLPPGVFILISGGAGVRLLGRKNRAGGAICLLVSALLWLASISPVSDALLRKLESPYEGLREPRGDVILLLGGGVNDKAPDLTGEGTPSEETLARLATAARLQRRLQVPVIVSGGRVFRHRAAEAPVVKRFLVDLGVPENRVIVEDGSRDTRENARLSARICRRYGYSSPILVTSAFHMRRAVLSFEREGERVSPCPAAFRTWSGKKYFGEDYLPNPSALKNCHLAIREYLGLLAARWGDIR